MKFKLAICLVSVAYSYGWAQVPDSQSQFDWLLGTWERQMDKPGHTSFESWGKNETGQLKGLGITLQNGDTVFVEKLSLVTKENKTYYVAEVEHNQEPTYFEITSSGSNGFVCENDKHDFPKKIEYQLDGNKLTATISGEGKSIPFYFKKVE